MLLISKLWKRLVTEHLATSKEEALAFIQAGRVKVNGQTVTNPASQCKRDDSLQLINSDDNWASRGAYKLLTALKKFPVSVEQKVCLDVGASTGGFTDVLLRHGAALVYALDVGYGQLLSRLATDSRVVVMDRTHVRELATIDLEPKPTVVVCDASFISLSKIIPTIAVAVQEGADFLLLIKPQFELPSHLVPEGGIVVDESLQKQAIESTKSAAVKAGLTICGLVPSDLRGTKGNQEYILWLKKPEATKE